MFCDDMKSLILTALTAKFEKHIQGDGTWHASESGYEGMDGYCPRRRVLHFHGIPEKVDDMQKLVFMRGHLAEEMAIMVLRHAYGKRNIKHNPWPNSIQVPLADGVTISVTPDSLINCGKNGRTYRWRLVEIKSVGVDSKLDGVKLNHRCQANMQMYALKSLKKDKKYQTDEMTVYYERVGRQFDITPMDVSYDESLTQQLYEETIKLATDFKVKPVMRDGTVMQELLPPYMSPARFPCIWATAKYRMRCGYFDLCYPDIIASAGAERIDDPSGDLESLAADWYEMARMQKDLKLKIDRAKLTLKAATNDTASGKMIGPYYIARNGTITLKENPEQEVLGA